jgi:hypothetical protein
MSELAKSYKKVTAKTDARMLVTADSCSEPLNPYFLCMSFYFVIILCWGLNISHLVCG